MSLRTFKNDVQKRIRDVNNGRIKEYQAIIQMAQDYSSVTPRCLFDPIYLFKKARTRPKYIFGQEGFRLEIIDDENPIRHYFAFVFVGYFLPKIIALSMLFIWEIIGSTKMKRWKKKDFLAGLIGIRHGENMRKHGLKNLIDNLQELSPLQL